MQLPLHSVRRYDTIVAYPYISIEVMTIEQFKNHGIPYLRLIESRGIENRDGRVVQRRKCVLSIGPLSRHDDGKPGYLARLRQSFRDGKPLVGEKARLLLAKVLKRGGNFLILDEPTNDLDLPTLRVLEEALAEFKSTLIVVSHDRYFLNRVCNHIIAFEEISPGVTVPLSTPGDYDYFLSVRNRLIDAHKSKLPQKNGKVETVPEVKKAAPVKAHGKKLSYREQQELLHMEENIAEAEEKLAVIESRFSEPDFFVKNAKNMPEFEAELAAAKAEVERLYARWDELEQLKNSL